MTQTTQQPQAPITYLGEHQPLPLLADFAVRVAVTLTKWRMRRVSRRKLAGLDDHLRRDIGLTYLQAHEEAKRWFWQP